MSITAADEAEWVEYMQRLHALELAGERTTLDVGPYAAILMVGAIQTATRHPNISPEHKRVLLMIIEQFRPLYAGTIGEKLLDLGNDPSFDR